MSDWFRTFQGLSINELIRRVKQNTVPQELAMEYLWGRIPKEEWDLLWRNYVIDNDDEECS